MFCFVHWTLFHCTARRRPAWNITELWGTAQSPLHLTALYFTTGATALHDVSEAVKLSVDMIVEAHAIIRTWWPGHLVGGLSGLTWPDKDTSCECPPHILQCHLYNVWGGCTAHQSAADLTLGPQGNLMGASRTKCLRSGQIVSQYDGCVSCNH